MILALTPVVVEFGWYPDHGGGVVINLGIDRHLAELFDLLQGTLTSECESYDKMEKHTRIIDRGGN